MNITTKQINNKIVNKANITNNMKLDIDFFIIAHDLFASLFTTVFPVEGSLDILSEFESGIFFINMVNIIKSI